MTVTFRAKDTKYHKYQPDPKDEPDWWDEEPDEGYYEINMANVNARDFLLLIGRTKELTELCGEWKADELHTILRQVIRLSNIDNGAAFEKSTEVGGNFVEFGRSSEYVRRRLDTMIKILKGAIDRGTSVTFA